jgi:outer membrane protein assembly factor BamB
MNTHEPTLRKPLRLWPGVAIAVLLLLARFGWKIVVPGFKGFAQGMQGAILCALVLIVWWVFFSRAPWSERLGAIALMAAGLAASWFLKHESMGPLWLVGYAVPFLFVAFVAWAVASRRLADRPRRAAMAATILIACGAWTLVRSDGITGNHDGKFAWRWTASPEERLLAQAADEPATVPGEPAAPAPAETPQEQPATQAGEPAAQAAEEAPEEPLASQAGDGSAALPARAGAETGADWPAFRGPERNGIVRGVRIDTNWSASPPVEL